MIPIGGSTTRPAAVYARTPLANHYRLLYVCSDAKMEIKSRSRMIRPKYACLDAKRAETERVYTPGCFLRFSAHHRPAMLILDASGRRSSKRRPLRRGRPAAGRPLASIRACGVNRCHRAVSRRSQHILPESHSLCIHLSPQPSDVGFWRGSRLGTSVCSDVDIQL